MVGFISSSDIVDTLDNLAYNSKYMFLKINHVPSQTYYHKKGRMTWLIKLNTNSFAVSKPVKVQADDNQKVAPNYNPKPT